MWTEAQTTVMQSVYDALGDIQHAIHPRNRPVEDVVEASLLASLGVVVSDLPLDPHEQVDMEPRYIDPLPKADLDEVFETYFDGGDEFQWPSPSNTSDTPIREWDMYDAKAYIGYITRAVESSLYLPSEVISFSPGRRLLREGGWNHSEISQFTLGPYARACLYQDPMWYTRKIYIANPIGATKASDLKPQAQISISHAAPFDGLLTSELLCIVTMMKKQIAEPGLAEGSHRLFPVVVYTYNGPLVRITQAVYDNGCLQIRQSCGMGIRCTDGDFSSVKLMMRWILGKPCGSTVWEETAEQSQEQEPLPSTDAMSPWIMVGA